MNYDVGYKINLNEKDAVSGLNSLLTTADSVLPKVDKRFAKLNTRLSTTLTLITKIKKQLGGVDRLNIKTKKSSQDLEKIQRKLNKLKNKKVTVTVKQKNVGGKSSGGKLNVLNKQFSGTSMLSAGGIPFATTLGAGMIGLGLRKIAQDAIEFRDNMVSVRSILMLSDKDLPTYTERFNQMSLNMRKLGVDTKFTAVEISEASRFLAMAGMDLNKIDKSMKTITNLATIGGAKLGETADVTTNIMSGYGVKAKDISTVGDIIATASSSANMSIMQMGESMKYASNYMRVGGISFNEGAAAIGIMGNAGIQGSLAGTAMRAMIIRFISPTRKAQKVIDRLGVSFTEFKNIAGQNREVIKPLQTIFKELKDAGASAEDLNKIFDKVGGAAALALTNSHERLGEITKATERAGGSANYLAKEKMANIAGLSDQISSKFMDLGQTMFDNLAPKIKMMMGDLLKWMKTAEASEVFNSIEAGISDVLDGLKGTVLFLKGNWDWLKYIFGGAVIGSVGGKVLRVGGGILSAGKGILGGLSSIGGLFTSGFTSSIASASTAAASLMGTLGAAAVGGVVVAGFAAIAKSLYDTYKASKLISETKTSLSDWSISQVGVDTSGLDVIQQKLLGIYNLQTQVAGKKNTNTQQTEIYSAMKAYSQATKWTFSKKKKSEKIDEIISSVSDYAVGGKRGKWVNEMFLGMINNPKSQAFQNALVNAQSKASIGIATDPSLRERILTKGVGRRQSTEISAAIHSREYAEADFMNINAKLNQANLLISSIASKDKGGILTFIDTMMGKDLSLKGAFGAISKGGLSGVDANNRLLAAGTSIAEIRATLGKRGILSNMIDKMFKISGLAEYGGSKLALSESGIKKINTEAGEADIKNALSGTGGLGGNRGRIQIVNINNLMNVEKAEVNTDDDIETFKNKLNQALTDTVNDFQIGNTI